AEVPHGARSRDADAALDLPRSKLHAVHPGLAGTRRIHRLVPGDCWLFCVCVPVVVAEVRPVGAAWRGAIRAARGSAPASLSHLGKGHDSDMTAALRARRKVESDEGPGKQIWRRLTCSR